MYLLSQAGLGDCFYGTGKETCRGNGLYMNDKLSFLTLDSVFPLWIFPFRRRSLPPSEGKSKAWEPARGGVSKGSCKGPGEVLGLATSILEMCLGWTA